MRRAAVLCGLLVVLAGCNVPFGPAGQPGTTPSPTPTTTPAASPTPSGTPLPNPRDVGLAADGVVEPLALRNAHVRSLENRSYTLQRSATVRRPNGTVVARMQQRVETGPGQDHFIWNRTQTVAADAGPWLQELYRDPYIQRAYSNDSTTVVEVLRDGDREVAVYEEDGSSRTLFSAPYRDFTGRDMVMRTFLQVETRVSEIDRDGNTVRYHLVDDRGPHDHTVDTTYEIESRVLSLSATVERSGLVRRLVLRYALEHGNETVVVRETLRITALDNTTVSEPPWADAAVAASGDEAATTNSLASVGGVGSGASDVPPGSPIAGTSPPDRSPDSAGAVPGTHVHRARATP